MAVGMALIGGHLVRTESEAEGLDVWPQEPRCRVCRDPDVRRLVNDLLRWRGVPVFLEGGKTHRITYAEILRALEPINEVRDDRDRITYSSLWVHAKRHYDLDGVQAYWTAWFPREIHRQLRKALGGRRSTRPIE
jgi:hypothetical protein